MRDPASSAAPAVRYLLRVPWIGPVLGGARDGQLRERICIGAAADPLLGPAFAALLVPVEAAEGRLRAVGEGWVACVAAEASVPFRLDVPPGFWDRAAAGLLMLLVYDRSAGWRQSDRLAPARAFAETLPEQLELHGGPAMTAGDFVEVPRLPPPMREELRCRLDEVLAGPPHGLWPGVVERGNTPAPDELVFAVGSCQYPAGFLDGRVAERSYDRLAQRFEASHMRVPPQCLLLLGDQVYLDATAGLFDPSTLYDRYQLPYERLFRMEPLRHLLRRIPAYTMLDDHEIEDNWEPGSGNPQALIEGRRWYIAYQRMADGLTPLPAQLWYSFEANGFPFFICDTRTGRQARTAANATRAHIMDAAQRAGLLAWLGRHAHDPRPKFIASPASFLPRHRRATHGPSGAGALRSDAWDGYPASFAEVAGCIAQRNIENVVFLSGDEHISFAATAQIRAPGAPVARIHSVHCSGLYAPFSFANASREGLATDDTFNCGPCDVELLHTDFAPPGDGFTLLRVSREGVRWRVEYLFDRDRQSGAAEPWTALPS